MGLTAATITYAAIMLGLLLLVVVYYQRAPVFRRWLACSTAMLAFALIVAVVLCLPDRPLRAARLLCIGWFVFLPLFLFTVVVLSKPRLNRIAVLSGLLCSVIGLLAVDCFWIEPFRLEVTHFQVTSPLVDTPLKIGVIADFQTDKLDAYEKASLATFMREQPDIIVMAGDYLQNETQNGWEVLKDRLRDYLQEIKFGAPLGVYAVGGNTDFQRWPEIFDGLGVTTFTDTQTLELDSLTLTGIEMQDSFDANLHVPKSDRFHIAVGHAPDFALGDVQADLLIAGHTHGGQVQLPWLGPIITFSKVPNAWATGMTKIDDTRKLVVSRGIGMERRDAPRIRFLCRPQLVFITVAPNDPVSHSR